MCVWQGYLQHDPKKRTIAMSNDYKVGFFSFDISMTWHSGKIAFDDD